MNNINLTNQQLSSIWNIVIGNCPNVKTLNLNLNSLSANNIWFDKLQKLILLANVLFLALAQSLANNSIYSLQ